jgi:hypothetical protein
LKERGFVRALLGKFSVLTVVVFLFFICAASEGWFGALLEKAF